MRINRQSYAVRELRKIFTQSEQGIRVSADKTVMKLLSSCLERVILSTIPTELTQNCVAGNLEFVNGKFATTPGYYSFTLTVLEK